MTTDGVSSTGPGYLEFSFVTNVRFGSKADMCGAKRDVR